MKKFKQARKKLVKFINGVIKKIKKEEDKEDDKELYI